MTFIFCSCSGINGSGNIKSEKRTVGRFDGVQSSASIDVEIRNGESPAVEVEADDNVLPYIVTEIKNGMLQTDYKPGYSFSNTHVKVYVTASTLNKIYSSGSADIVAKEGITNGDMIDIQLSGSGNITAQVNAPTVRAELNGSGNLDLQGRTKNFDCSITGSGDANCRKLLSENTDVSVGGSGNANVYASISLKATASGSGDISYGGNPSSPETHTSGSGSIQADK